MDDEIVFLPVYPCPGCGVELEAKEGPTSGWVRCPKCGRPSLPPADGLARYRSPLANRGHLTGKPGAELPSTTAERGGSPGAHTGLKILVFLGGVGLTVFYSMFMSREPREIVALAGVTAAALLVLLRPRGQK